MSILHPKGPDHEGMLKEVMDRLVQVKPELKELVADLVLLDHANRHNLTDAQRETLTKLHAMFNEIEELVHGYEGAPVREETHETITDVRARLGFE